MTAGNRQIETHTERFVDYFYSYLVLIESKTSGVPRSSVWIAEVKVRRLTYERGK